MNDVAQDQIRISIEVDDSDEAREVEETLKAAGASDVETTGEGEEGILPIAIIVGAIAAVAAIADAIERWRKNHMCQETIDARNNAVKISKDCSIKDGRIIVISSDNQKVEIHDVPDGFDIGKTVEAALKSGADAVKAVADAAGAKTGDPEPAETTAAS
jgi:hypothetical protein